MIGVTQLLSNTLVGDAGQTGVELDSIPTQMGSVTSFNQSFYNRAIDMGDGGKKIGVGSHVGNRTYVYSMNSPGVLPYSTSTYYDVNHYRGVNWNFTGTQTVGRSHTGNTTYYNLNTPWVVSGSSITPGINFNSQQGIFFSSDGFHFNVWNGSAIAVYSLSVQNDITSTPTLLGTYNYNASSRPGIYSAGSNTTGFGMGRLVRNGTHFCGYRQGTGKMEIYSLGSPYDLTSMTLTRSFTLTSVSGMAIDPTMKALAWYTSDSTATIYTAPLI